MKNIFKFFVIAFFIVSCEKDDCPEREASIHKMYAEMFQNEHLTPAQRQDLKEEYDRKLETACD